MGEGQKILTEPEGSGPGEGDLAATYRMGEAPGVLPWMCVSGRCAGDPGRSLNQEAEAAAG